MFGRNDFAERIKAALAEAEGDTEAFRSWQKRCERLKKSRREKEDRYRTCRQMTLLVQQDAQLLEQMLTREPDVDRREFGKILKDLRQMRGKFDHEFLISSRDQEFHSTYDTIVRLGVRALEPQDQRLLLQSEIENLIELVKENLEKEQPPFCALAFYDQSESRQDLEELSPADRLVRIQEVYEREFYEPGMKILTEGIEKVGRLAAVCEKMDDRSSKKTLAVLAVLRGAEAEQIFDQMMEE